MSRDDLIRELMALEARHRSSKQSYDTDRIQNELLILIAKLLFHFHDPLSIDVSSDAARSEIMKSYLARRDAS